MTGRLHTLAPDPSTMRTVGGHFATGVAIVTIRSAHVTLADKDLRH